MMNARRRISILHTEQCTLAVDPQKNRIHANIHGKCEELSDSSLLLEELHELKHHLTRGFTMLVDARQKEARFQWRYARLMHDVLDLLFEGGIRKIAEIRSGSPLSQMPPTWNSEQIMPGVHRQVFLDREEAEAWLDA